MLILVDQIKLKYIDLDKVYFQSSKGKLCFTVNQTGFIQNILPKKIIYTFTLLLYISNKSR